MSETVAQANHELLLGIGRDMKTITHALETISQQLLDQRQAMSPALGLCAFHAEEWLETGGDPGAILPAAQTVVIAQGVGAVPVCLVHFRAVREAQNSSRLVAAQPGMPQQRTGLIVPG